MSEIEPVLYILFSLIGGMAVGVFAFYFYRRMIEGRTKKTAQKEADRIVHKAKSQAAKMDREAKNKSKDFETRARRNVESDIQKQKQKMKQQEQSLKDKEVKLEREYKRKEARLEEQNVEMKHKEDEITKAQKNIQVSHKDLEVQMDGIKKRVANVSGLSEEQARAELKAILEEEVREEISGELSVIESKVIADVELKAKRTLSSAIARFASEVSTENTVNIVTLTSEEMKGKIIGREGRNIRAIEAACGVDLIIDETPESVVISSFDPVRREVAERSLEKLMADGRIHPARIEEAVDKSKSELFGQIREDGEQACMDVGIHGVHKNIQKLIGSLKYRSFEMQNLLKESLDISYVAGVLAGEVGMDPKLAKRAGLLHSIGRAIDHTVEGSYAKVGSDFARRHQESEEICHAILAQNEEVPAESLLDHIIQAAVHLVNVRPGRKKHMLDSFVKRLSDLESVGNSFDGVYRTFAVQSGKEIRVLVDSGKITDDQAKMLTRDISKKIERELNYPGQVRVSVLRETRIVEHAR